ncbi:ZP domain-containing protein-like [Porites lutea]|uniref:ZP domain-containing protein-like n=1 Tax=Porites lutea TaxID=51062 RepID=UPI003CC5B103
MVTADEDSLWNQLKKEPAAMDDKPPTKCDPNPCMNGATCRPAPQSLVGYKCTCSPGYEGVNCDDDVDECAEDNGGCSHKCKNTKGSFVCSCPDPELNLAPNRRTCVASGVSVQCHQNDMSITLPKALLLGLNREHVTLRDVKCVATETRTNFTLKTALTGCGTTARHRGGFVVYSNTVLEIPVADDAIITRVREIEIPFSCFYKNSGDATAVGVKPDTRKLVFDENGKGNFTVALDMFPDKSFEAAYTQSDYPVEVKLRQYLFFQASVKTKDKTLSVLAENCYATPSQDRQHDDKYHLIKEGCPVDKTTITIQSQKVGVDRFSTEAFKFIADHPFVFVHCQIRICDARNPGSRCAQRCIKEGRLRRDVSDEDKLYPLAQGPLTFASDATEMKSSISDMTVPAVITMGILSALCLMGMAYLSLKNTSKATAYTIVPASF